MKNKVGAQMGAFIKMKQENMYIYQRILVFCYVPIIPLKPLWDSFSLMSAKALKLNALIAEPGHQNCHHCSESSPWTYKYLTYPWLIAR
ncbi:hypothetical protein B6I57_21860 [Klebsiella quasipneumoniae]|nr:hypothetical protein B6I57_21860 [Klebsiella quasipneumoniae]PLF06697.1 hypothetical protein B6I82_16755 [Klebsiella quasipneumoniae]